MAGWGAMIGSSCSRVSARRFATISNVGSAVSLGCLVKGKQRFHSSYQIASVVETVPVKDTIKVSKKYAEFSIYLDEMWHIKTIKNKSSYIKKLSQAYEEFQSLLSQTNELDALKIHDMNVFLDIFLRLGQLKKAHIVLNDLIDHDSSLIHGDSRDIDTVRNYLRVRCGSFSEMWYSDRSYNIIDTSFVYNIMEYCLTNKFSFWDKEICYALGYMNSMEIFEKFINKKWGISLRNEVIASDIDNCPSVEIISAIVKSICYIYEGGIIEINKFLNILVKRYPNVKLDINFWRTLILEGNRVNRTTKFKNKNGNELDNWKSMKEWYEIRNRIIPFDYSTVKELYEIVERTKNLKDAVDIYCSCFTKFYKQRNKISANDWAIISKYQKFIIRRLVNKKKFNKTNDFIAKWSIDSNNENMLREFANYLKIVKKNRKVGKSYDEMIEDDMILGPLW